MTLLPRSLFGRLMLTFVGVMALTVSVTMAVQMSEREAFVFRVSSEGAAHWLADQLKLMDRLPASGRDTLVEIAERRAAHVTFGVEPPELAAHEPGSNAAAFHDLLLEDLGQQWPVAVEVTPTQLPQEGGTGETRDAYAFNVRARLSDGTWVGFASKELRRLPRWPKRSTQNTLVMLAVLSVLSLIAMRWVTRPLHRLAQAAEELGRDIN